MIERNRCFRIEFLEPAPDVVSALLLEHAASFRSLSRTCNRFNFSACENAGCCRSGFWPWPVLRASVEGDARLVLEHALPAMMRCRLGTPWDFNGTAKGPGAGISSPRC